MRPDDHRRKWDKDEFERIAAERLKAEIEEEENSKKKGKAVFFVLNTHYVYQHKGFAQTS